MKWFLQAMQKYAVFSGRARRKEYWYFMLYIIIFYIPVFMIDRAFISNSYNPQEQIPVASLLYFLFLFLPSLAVTVRRLHDISHSGWWVLLNWVPLGGVVVFIFTLIPSTTGDNEYGPNPLDEDDKYV